MPYVSTRHQIDVHFFCIHTTLGLTSKRHMMMPGGGGGGHGRRWHSKQSIVKNDWN